MNINNLVSNLNFRKVIFLILIVLAANFLLHEILFWSYFHKFQQVTKNFDKQFVQDQQSIHNKIVEMENGSDKWSKEFDKQQDEFDKAVDKRMKENMDYIQNSQKQMTNQQQIFDKKFAEMPDKMWEAHKEFARASLDAFSKEGKQMADIRAKQFKFDNEHDNYRKFQDKLIRENKNKQSWEEARIRYHDLHGVWLPTYETAFNKTKS
ncbi:MAG: hypothetical protein ABI597_10125 [Gammaproteobacteria bacterium]